MPLGPKSKIRSASGQIASRLVLAALIGLLALGRPHHGNPASSPAIGRHPYEVAKPSLNEPFASPASPAKSMVAARSSSLSPMTLEPVKGIANSRIALARVELRPLSEEITARGVVAYDQTRVAQLAPRVSGTVWSVQKKAGQAVCKGEVLAIIEALEVGRTKTEFLKAIVNAELKASTLQCMRAAPSAIPQQRIREADAEAREARIDLFNAQQTLANLGLPIRLAEVADLRDEELVRRVRFLGLPESLVKEVDPTTTTANLIPLTAPFDGVITGGEMVIGELLSPASRAQIEMADVSRMWIEIEVQKKDATKLRCGQEAAFTVEGLARELRSELSWISTEIDSRTRNVLARMEVNNPLACGGGSGLAGQRLLRANMFGEARIQIQANPEATVVPNSAIQRDGATSAVFVKTSDTEFQPRIVRLGMTDGEFTEVLEGVSLGETVAAAASRILKAEIANARPPIRRN